MHPRLLHINTSHILFFPLLSYCPTILHTHRQGKSSSVFPGMLPDPLRCHLLKGRQLSLVYRNGCTDKAQDNSLCMTSAPSIPHDLVVKNTGIISYQSRLYLLIIPTVESRTIALNLKGDREVKAFHCQRQIELKLENSKSVGVTTEMKALEEYILMVLFVLLLKSSFSCKRNLKV